MVMMEWEKWKREVGIVDCVGKEVILKLKEKNEVRGWIYAIDPEFYHVILITDCRATLSSAFVFSHSIEFIEELTGNEQICQGIKQIQFLPEVQKSTNEESATLNFEKMTQLLSKARIPFDLKYENEEKSLQSTHIDVLNGSLIISYPFEENSFKSNNSTILLRFQSLLKQNA